jgi:RimJ/RimL family protein N-acetyltransferase
MKYLFLVRDLAEDLPEPEALPAIYRVDIWRPSLGSVKPKGTPWIPFGVWWIFHLLRIFYNRDYCLVVVYEGDRLIHRTCVFPGYFRFPFMARADLQIGDTWTDDAYRGKGLAPWAIRKVFAAFGRQDRRLWYITSEDNAASIRAAEKGGFAFHGHGRRIPRFGLKPLGAYVIDETK